MGKLIPYFLIQLAAPLQAFAGVVRIKAQKVPSFIETPWGLRNSRFLLSRR
jgi:hypothetical protein